MDSENNEGDVVVGDVVVALTPDEAKFVMECLVNCPVMASVKMMPSILGMVQGIIKKLQPPAQTPEE